MLNTLDEPALLSAGVYGFTEATRYLRAARHGAGLYPRTPRTIAGWFRRWTADSEYSESPGGEFPVTFSDLISMRLVGALRVSGVAWPEIHAVVRQLREHTEAQHPLASKDIWCDEGLLEDACTPWQPHLTFQGRISGNWRWDTSSRNTA